MAQAMQGAGKMLEYFLKPGLAAFLQQPGKGAGIGQGGRSCLSKTVVADCLQKYGEKPQVMLRQKAHVAAVKRHANGRQVAFELQHDRRRI